MALIKCPSCEKDISDRAKKCPGCGWVNGSNIDKNVPKEADSNLKVIENDTELEKILQKNQQLENEIYKLQNKIVELSSATQDTQNLKKLVVKLNGEKLDLEKQLKEELDKKSAGIDKTDYELIQKLKAENELLLNDNLKLQNENTNLVNLKKDPSIDNILNISINIMMKRKYLILGLAGMLLIIVSILCVYGYVSTVILRNELSMSNFATANNKEAADGYRSGDVICEINGVSVFYESCTTNDKVTEI